MSWITRTACLNALGALASLAASASVGWVAQVAPAHAADLRSQVEQYRVAHEAAIVGEIDSLTRLKSIAADPAGLIATAHALEAALRTRGFEVSELATGPSSPPAVPATTMSPTISGAEVAL